MNSTNKWWFEFWQDAKDDSELDITEDNSKEDSPSIEEDIIKQCYEYEELYNSWRPEDYEY